QGREMDDSGQTLPQSAQGGQAQWFTEAAGQGTGRLLEVRLAGSLARAFNCQGVVVLCGASNTPTSVNIPQNTTTNISAIAKWCLISGTITCPGGTSTTQVGSSSTTWSVSSGVLSIQGPNTGTQVTVKGVSPGSA